ncbi:hypothetical protein Q6670_004036 [Salmonella enterica]|nr:hypothetical protein [Salmonella enterica]
MKTVTNTANTPCVFTSRLAAVWEALTTLAAMPTATRMRNERLKVIVNHLKRDAAVTGNPHLSAVAEQLEVIRRAGGGK